MTHSFWCSTSIRVARSGFKYFTSTGCLSPQAAAKRTDNSGVNIDIPRTETVTPLYNTQSACLQLTVAGDLKSTTTAALHRDVFAILAHDYARSLSISIVELDISAATLVDSLGLNLVIAVLKWSQQRGAALRIIVNKRGVYSTMLAVGLDRQAELINTDPS
jgi:anti-anti-sigma regulatory factor